MSGFSERAQEIFTLKEPGRQTQREKILWIHQHRMNGTWVKCFQCEKWRYLKNIFDPVDIPDKWQCSMNLDCKYNNCEEPQSKFDDSTVVKLKYTAGSLVWVLDFRKRYRWPAMIDDDPGTGQFYWLRSHPTERIAYKYHLVYIDVDYKDTSRQWVIEDQLSAFTWYNSQIIPGKRLTESISIAREALDLSVFQRLQKFSFARRYQGHILSITHDLRVIRVEQEEELRYESDCTLLSCTDSEDEEYFENLREGHPWSIVKKKKAVINPYYYFKGKKESEVASESDSDSIKNIRVGRANSLGPKYRVDRSSLELGLSRTTYPKQKTPQHRGRAFLLSSKERSFGDPLKENKKRDYDFDSRTKRTSSRVKDIDSKSGNERSASVLHCMEAKSRNKRSPSVVLDFKVKTRNKRSVSVVPDSEAKSRYSSDFQDTNSYLRNRRASTSVPETDSDSRKKTSSVSHDFDFDSKAKRTSSEVKDIDSKSRNGRSSSVLHSIEAKSRNKRSLSATDSEAKPRNKRSLSAPDSEAKPRNKRSLSVIPNVDSSRKSRNTRSSSIAPVSKEKSTSKRYSSDFQYTDSYFRNRRASTVVPEAGPDYRKKTASPVSRDHSRNDKEKKKVALPVPDGYFKADPSKKGPTLLYRSGYSNSKLRSRRASSVVDCDISANISVASTSSTAFGDSSRRHLRSQTRIKVEESYKLSVYKESRCMSSMSSSLVTDRLSSGIPPYQRMIKTVYEIKKLCKYVSPTGGNHFRGIRSESYQTRPY